MKISDKELFAFLPHQPPAGKLAYFLKVSSNSDFRTGSIKVPDEPVIIRFKGSVPRYFLIPHIFLMFFSLMLTLRIGFSIISGSSIGKLVLINFLLLLAGGIILGPIVQKYAFGDLWTGFPFGNDLTDNKILVVFIFWLFALVHTRKETRGRIITAAAIVVMLLSYLIPHSMWGSEFDYSSKRVTTGPSK